MRVLWDSVLEFAWLDTVLFINMSMAACLRAPAQRGWGQKVKTLQDGEGKYDPNAEMSEELRGQILEISDGVYELLKGRSLRASTTAMVCVLADLITRGIDAGVSEFLGWTVMDLHLAVQGHLVSSRRQMQSRLDSSAGGMR